MNNTPKGWISLCTFFWVDFKMCLVKCDMFNAVIHVALKQISGCKDSALCLDILLSKAEKGKSSAMLSWCPTEGAVPPEGNESRGGLLPVDFHV